MQRNGYTDRLGQRAFHALALLASLLAALVVLLTLTPPVRAQANTTWEYSPYHIRVWIAAEQCPELPAQLLGRVRRAVATQARLMAGATWRVQVDSAPNNLADSLVMTPDLLTIDSIVKKQGDVFAADKVMLLSLRADAGTYTIACRELDGATRRLGQILRRRTSQVELVPYVAAGAMIDVFTALVRIEHSRGKSGVVRARAGGLVRHTYCPSRVTTNDVLAPIIRRNDRAGNPRPGGIQVLDWTYLIVRGPAPSATGNAPVAKGEETQKKKTAAPAKEKGKTAKKVIRETAADLVNTPEVVLQCTVYSAMRNPLAGRNSVRIQRLALKVHPFGKRTQLRLLSRDQEPRPLEGYQIFAKPPLPKDPNKPRRPARLGLTDWRGMIEVARGAYQLRIAYVKNGNHLLARLPMVPGLEPEQSIQLPSDDARLEAEAFVSGVESMVMDLVARRAILAARIRRRLKEGRVQDARKLLDEIKSFRTRDDLEAMIANRQKTSFHSADPREQQRIDKMLSGTRILLNKYLDPEQLVALQREVENPNAAKKPAKKPASKTVAQKKANQPSTDNKATTKSSP